ncbi:MULTISPECIES: hypothetical protein [Acinetobacter]|nr:MULTISPECIES: hypothetical protein [Acinetobacter]MDM1287082.1 hypothetical protein [Acinetobacter indicus]MDM1493280.1 hypothetical protein [Acinetobacter indicus]QOW52612.1 hypothetical protein G0030_05145 [Acinetobacter indicus]
MKIKTYSSKGFIGVLLLIIFMAWFVLKCIPLSEQEQNAKISSKMERQRLRLAQEFDRYTLEEQARLPKYDSRKYALIKRNSRFWLIPREYFSDNGFHIRWPNTVNRLLKRNWENKSNKKYPIVRVLMESRQFNASTGYAGNDKFLNVEPCKNGNDWFIWNGINVRIYPSDVPNLSDRQRLDICLTVLKILNEEIKEIKEIS